MKIINDATNYIANVFNGGSDPVRNTVKSTDIAGGTFKSQGNMNFGNKLFSLSGKDSKMVVNDGANDRILIGKRKDGTLGIDVAQSGQDVNTPGTDNENLVMSSDFNLFKIVKVLTGSFTLTDDLEGGFAGINPATIAHGLSYAPLVMGGCKPASGGYYMPFGCAGATLVADTDGDKRLSYESGAPYYCIAWADATNIYIKFMCNYGPSESVSYKIYCIRETLS